MAILKVARVGHPVLRQGATSVTKEELSSQQIQDLIDNMIETMREGDGVGLAATQVYNPERIVIIEVKGDNPRYPGQPEIPLTIIVNPVISAHSEETEDGWEGCLSIPDLRGKVPRYKSITVTGQDRDGQSVNLKANNFFARVIQHEVDHLDGIIFLDRMKDLSTLTYIREYHKYWENSK